MPSLFPAAVYVLCFLTSTACATLLGRGYARTSARVLMWSALCFAFLAANNLVLFIDMVLVPDLDLMPLRQLCSLAAVCVLLFGFIWDIEE